MVNNENPKRKHVFEIKINKNFLWSDFGCYNIIWVVEQYCIYMLIFVRKRKNEFKNFSEYNFNRCIGSVSCIRNKFSFLFLFWWRRDGETIGVSLRCNVTMVVAIHRATHRSSYISDSLLWLNDGEEYSLNQYNGNCFHIWMWKMTNENLTFRFQAIISVQKGGYWRDFLLWPQIVTQLISNIFNKIMGFTRAIA